ncbi:hypothetical protein VTL71DRAFT_2971 [Oculimacula yallundae]|uniref:Uncharacterized protein n=1 Tax=Oculimacula yallundae TaxID=86028 RepID=A0ABR4C5U1_9HELO
MSNSYPEYILFRRPTARSTRPGNLAGVDPDTE